MDAITLIKHAESRIVCLGIGADMSDGYKAGRVHEITETLEAAIDVIRREYRKIPIVNAD